MDSFYHSNHSKKYSFSYFCENVGVHQGEAIFQNVTDLRFPIKFCENNFNTGRLLLQQRKVVNTFWNVRTCRYFDEN